MRTILTSAIMAATFTLPALAQDVPDDDETDLGGLLGRIILSGGLTPAPEAALGRAVTVITGDEIRERGIDTVAEALRGSPGVSINQSGGPGGPTQMRLRGTEGRHVQVILDGVRLDPPQNGEFDLSGLQTADIERIEIVRGPQSVFFGSNTIGGVVSITTRRGRAPGISGEGGIEAGSDGTIGTDLTLSARGERGGLTFSGVVRNDAGHDISATPGGARDGMRNRTLNLAGDWQLTDAWTIGFLLRARNQTNEFDPQQDAAGPIAAIVFDRDDFIQLDERIGSVYAEGALFDGRLNLSLRLSRFEIDTRRFFDALQASDDSADRTELSLRGVVALDSRDHALARHTLGFGVDYTVEGFVNNNPAFVFDPSQLVRQDRSLTGLSLEYRGNLAPGFDVQLGVRHDLNDRFRDFTSYSAALSYSLPDTGTRLRASFGTGVQNPTLFNQFGFIPGSFEGNPDLVPEQSTGWDVGVDQGLMDGRVLLSATYFQNVVTDRITVGPGSTPFVLRPVNAAGSSPRNGVELALDAIATETVRLRGGYTYTRARDESDRPLVRRPRHELALGVDWDATEALRLSVDARHVRGNLDFDFRGFNYANPPIVALPDYTLVDLAAVYRINDRVSLTGRVSNVFDTSHQEVLGYAGRGRTFFVGLRSTF